MYNKKAQGLSLNAIIIAALALLVLVIIAVIFVSEMRDKRVQIDSCTNQGGKCAANMGANTCQQNFGEYSRQVNYKCYSMLGQETTDVCCVTA